MSSRDCSPGSGGRFPSGAWSSGSGCRRREENPIGPIADTSPFPPSPARASIMSAIDKSIAPSRRRTIPPTTMARRSGVTADRTEYGEQQRRCAQPSLSTVVGVGTAEGPAHSHRTAIACRSSNRAAASNPRPVRAGLPTATNCHWSIRTHPAAVDDAPDLPREPISDSFGTFCQCFRSACMPGGTRIPWRPAIATAGGREGATTPSACGGAGAPGVGRGVHLWVRTRWVLDFPAPGSTSGMGVGGTVLGGQRRHQNHE